MATTNLQFTLTSPSPTPTPTPTPSTPTYTTTVGSPNTGENSVASDNGGGTVFAALFAIIGFTALAIFLVKYLKKNRHVSFAESGSFHISARPRVYATVALTLAVAFLGGITITNMYNNAKNTEAASQRELEVTVEPSIVFDVDRDESSIKTDTIKVANNGAKYDLYVSSTNNKFTLDSDSTVFLSPVSAAITSPNSAIDINQWGMTTQNISNPDVAASSWAAAPTSETKIKSETTESTTPVTYAVNLGDELPDGTYRSSVTYKAIAKNYKVTVINGFVNETGSDTEAWFDADVKVRIRENCSANQAFKVWTVREGLKTAADITLVNSRTYEFTMPANDVTVEATCEGSTPEGDPWEIRYDGNVSGVTGTMNPTPVATTTSSAQLASNSFVRTGYTFQGWSCTSGKPEDATLIKFNNGQSVTQASLEAAGCPKTPRNEETNPPTVEYYTLYAIWKKNEEEPKYIQDVTPEMCNNMAFFEIKTLPDRRVETGAEKTGYTYVTDSLGKHVQYSYTKYGDGRCWMLQDLAYHPTGSTTLTVADTDVSEQRTVNFGTSGTPALYYTQSGYSTLYNYEAATGGYWSKWTNKSVDKVVPDSLCPASWKIPDASHSPVDPSYGTNAGELYGLWNYNVGKANGYGSAADVTWKRNFMFGETVTISSGTVTAPHFTYNGARDFGNNTWADDGGNATNGAPGKYASYFLNTTTTKNGSIAPAAYNPHKPGVESGDPDIDGIGVTDAAHGSAVRCLLRTAEQRTNRNIGAGSGDATSNN